MKEAKPARFGGVVIPMITPFTADGAVDEMATSVMIDRLLDAGTRSFLLLGTTGEAASISASAKLRFVARCLARISGRAHVYVGLANNSLAETTADANAYARLGADAVVAHLPNHYPLSAHQMHQWFERVADESPLPVFLYNIPMMTTMTLPIEVIQKLADHTNIFGMTDSEHDEARMETLIAFRKQRDDFLFFVGPSTMSMRGLQLGADGFVPAIGNVLPDACHRLYEAARAGNWEGAARAQNEMKRVRDTYRPNRSVGDAIAMLKAVLAELGACSPHVLPPLTPAGAEDYPIIIRTLSALLPSGQESN